MSTSAGDRPHRIEFQRATITKSGLGVDQPAAWTRLQRAWAKVLFGTGTERRQAAAEGAAMTATFRVPSTSALRGVTEQDRIWFHSRGWGITSIAPIGVNDEIEFTATTAKG